MEAFGALAKVRIAGIKAAWMGSNRIEDAHGYRYQYYIVDKGPNKVDLYPLEGLLGN